MNKTVATSLVILMSLSGVFLWSQDDSEWIYEHGWYNYVGTLMSDSNRGETWLFVDWVDEGRVDTTIMIEDRDHGHREGGQVRDVYGHQLILREPLGIGFLKGSRIYQPLEQ